SADSDIDSDDEPETDSEEKDEIYHLGKTMSYLIIGCKENAKEEKPMFQNNGFPSEIYPDNLKKEEDDYWNEYVTECKGHYQDD
ncbi:hypothetical protein A2U01_0072708, partial [Trifolium medium]|nr:hypothetical protein [Trifolium medium]